MLLAHLPTVAVRRTSTCTAWPVDHSRRMLNVTTLSEKASRLKHRILVQVHRVEKRFSLAKSKGELASCPATTLRLLRSHTVWQSQQSSNSIDLGKRRSLRTRHTKSFLLEEVEHQSQSATYSVQGNARYVHGSIISETLYFIAEEMEVLRLMGRWTNGEHRRDDCLHAVGSLSSELPTWERLSHHRICV